MTVSVSSFSNFLSLIEAGTWTASDQGTGAFYSGTPPIGSKAYDLSFANRSSDDIKNGTWPKNWILAQEYFKNTQPSYWINSTEIGKEIGSLSKNGQFTSWAESQLPSDSSQTTIKSLALNLENQAWAEASKLYANQATGDVIAFVNGANVGTTDSYTGAVFAQIELPRLLRNQSVTTINGIDREVLVKNYYGVSDDTQVSLTTGTNLDALQRVLDVLAISSEKYVPSTGSSNSGGGGSSTLPDDDDTSQDVGSNTTVNSNGDGNNLYMMGDYSTINAAGKNNTISSYGTGGTLNGTTQIVLLYGVVPGTTQQTFNMNGDDNSVRIIGSYNLLLSGNGNIINSNSYGSNFSTNYIKINIKGSSNTFNDTIGKSIINFSSYTFDNTIVGGSETITASYDVLNVKGTYDLVTGDQDTINVEDGTSTSVVGVDTINMAAGSNNDWVNDDHADYVNIGGVDDTINAASGNTVAIADHTWDNTVLGENEKITASYDALNVKGTYDLVSGDQDTINVEDGTSTSVVGVDTINMAAGSNNDWVNDDHADYVNIGGVDDTINAASGNTVAIADHTWDNTVLGENEKITASYDALNVKGTYDLVTGDQDTINVEDGTSTSVVGVDTINMAAGSNNDWVNDDHADYVNIGGVDDTINAASGNIVAISDHTWDNTVLGENEKITASYDALNVKGTYDLVTGDQDTINVEDGTSTSVVGVDTINMAAGSNNDWVNSYSGDYVNIDGSNDTINAATGNTVHIGSNVTGDNVIGSASKIFSLSNSTFSVNGAGNTTEISSNSNVKISGDKNIINAGTSSEGSSVTISGQQYTLNVGCSNITINSSTTNNNNTLEWSSSEITNGTLSTIVIADNTKNIIINGSFCDVILGKNCSIVMNGGADVIFGLSNDSIKIVGSGGNRVYASNSYVESDGINGNKAFTDVYGNKIKANGSVDIYHYDNENLFNNTSSIQYDDSRSSSGNPGFAFEDESDTGGTGVPSTSFDWSSSSLGGGSGSSDDDDIDDDDDTDSDSEIYAEDGLSASASQYVDVLNQSGENGLSQTDGWQRAEDAIKEAATGATAEMTPLSEPVNAGGNATITWNFAQDNPGSANDLYAGSIQDQYQDAIETAINEWSQATGLTFKEVSDTSSSDIRIGWGDFDTTCTGVAGLTFYGDSSNPSDLIELENPLQDALVSNGTNDYDYAGTSVDLTQLALHEIGHTLGLAESSNQYSIMFPELGENNRSLDSQDVAEVKDLYHLSSDTSVTALLKQAAATFDVGGATGSLVTTSHSDTFENPLLAVHAA